MKSTVIMPVIVSLCFMSKALMCYSVNADKLNEAVFTCIYRTNAWLDKDSRSGPGSNMQQTAELRRTLPTVFTLLLKEINKEDTGIILDVACGDFFWMQKLATEFPRYIGADIVPDIVNENKRLYEKGDRVTFCQLDLINEQLPQADIVICRDCLPHLSFKDIKKAINNIKKSGAQFLLTSTYVNRTSNADLDLGQQLHLWRFRPLNMQCAPFNFSEPIAIINEQNTENNGSISDKSLGLWRVQDLPDYNT